MQVVRDVATDPGHLGDIDEKSDFVTRELLAAPMIFRDQVIGVVEAINRREGNFQDSDIEVLQVFAELAAAGVNNARAHEQLKRENAGLRESFAARDSGMLGQSAALRQVQGLCQRVARSNATVLLLGETGTGKELTARHIHSLSDRKDRPFIGINCAALAETLLESELFGHEKGAFTGAVARKIGRFELAEGGTLFLDEIGDMSPTTQAKILRVLQEGEFERLGGTKTIKVDVRLIAATHKDLQRMVEEGSFRQDLFFRLSVVPLELPPLRERAEDIPTLAGHFLEKYSVKNRKDIRGLHPEALDALLAYAWPGNIRELENTLERAVILCLGEQITLRELPVPVRKAAESTERPFALRPGHTLKEMEKDLIRATLVQTDGNRTRAAEILGISRQTLQNKLKEYGLLR